MIPKSLWHRNDWESEQSFPILNNRFTFIRYAKSGQAIQDYHFNQIERQTKIVSDKFFYSSNSHCEPDTMADNAQCPNVTYLYGSDIDNLQGLDFDLHIKTKSCCSPNSINLFNRTLPNSRK